MFLPYLNGRSFGLGSAAITVMLAFLINASKNNGGSWRRISATPVAAEDCEDFGERFAHTTCVSCEVSVRTVRAI